ncbi:putative transport protein [Ruaniaceae bacterium KH17]|nr:putative transport protein [Ruaniaceae bacterium KH17]
MADLLIAHPLLTLFFVVGLGALIGAIRFGPVRFGAAGVLFVGLALAAWNPELGEGMEIVQQLGLALFVYTVGIAAGSTFFQGLRRQIPLLATSAVLCLLGAMIAVGGGTLLNLDRALTTGLYTGALTAAPALDAATRISGDPQAAVGYAFGYPIGVIVGIVVVSMTVTRSWVGAKDAPSLAASGLDAITVRVRHTMQARNLPAWAEQRIRMSYLRREGVTRVAVPGEELRGDDLVLLVGDPESLNEAFKQVGDPVVTHLADDRSEVAFEWIVVSNPDVAGRTVADLKLPVKFGAVMTRVKRGDLELLARDDLALQLGDRAAVVVPVEELEGIQDYLGDSQRRVSEVDAMALGVGLVLGMALGAISFPMPGGGVFQLGPAAGPLIVGMILGALRRAGPVVWTMPESANLTIRQVGLMLFLTGLGLTAGDEFALLLASPDGWKAAILSVVIAGVCCAAFAVAGRYLGLSAARTAGGVAGFLGQPAVLQAAEARAADERIGAAYATLFAFSIVVKILLVPLIWELL